MPLYFADCPRCGAHDVTFDTHAQVSRGVIYSSWVERFEIFCTCRKCKKSTIFIADNNEYKLAMFKDNIGEWLSLDGYLNDHVEHRGYVNIKDNNVGSPPEFIPERISEVYKEGLTCRAVECWNAAGAMFRACIDLATKDLLPAEGEEPNAKIRRSLGLRLEWLFRNGKIPSDLKELADAIQQDGNDGAHDCNLSMEDALDIEDFTEQLLTRLFTEPAKLSEAKRRRTERRAAKAS